MFSSLRFRLPALFLAAIALSGLVTSLIAIRLFQDYTREQTLTELRQEARGLAALYAESAVRATDEEKAAPGFAAEKLEAATGDNLYYVGVSIFPGEDVGLTRVSLADVGADLSRDRVVTFEFRPPGQDLTFLAAAHPLRPGGDTGPIFGYLIVAKEKSLLRDAWVTLLSASRDRLPRRARRRRCARVLPLAADHAARARPLRRGRRGLEGPLRRRGAARSRRRRDRPPRRPLPRDDRTARRGGGARAQLPDVRLARAADAADGDPRPCRGAPRGRRHRSGDDRRLARDASRRRRSGSAASSATCSTWRSSTRTASPC